MNGRVDDRDLPQLQSVTLGWCTFYGDTEDEQKTTDVYPFNFKNMLVLKSRNGFGVEMEIFPS